MTIAFDSRSAFGAHCFQCGHYLIAPEKTEYCSEQHAHHVWHCSNCKHRFETLVCVVPLEAVIYLTREKQN